MIIKNQDFECEYVDGLAYLFNIKEGIGYDFSEVTSDIWMLVDSKSVDEICDILHDKYDVEKTLLKKDIQSFVDECINEGLLYNEEICDVQLEGYL
ncbi:MAG: PqqD family protein [Defluviitaleaceae bacterium]|nr:PqqD family protein [Defluviitaleaceae bacterium]